MWEKEFYRQLMTDRAEAVDRCLQRIIHNSLADTGDSLQHLVSNATAAGRRFRPLLVLLSCEGCGGDWTQTLELACAAEFLHKASLLHDDLVDGDELRRGVPAFWMRQGSGQAVIIGDLLIGLAMSTTSRWCRERLAVLPGALRASEAISVNLLEMAAGESLDLAFELAGEVSAAQIRDVLYLKCGSLISLCMRLGAIAAGADPSLEDRLGDLGRHIGVIFQMMNDLNNITGIDVESKGAIGQDFRRGKKTLATVALTEAGVTPAQLASLSASETRTALLPALDELDAVINTAARRLDDFAPGLIRGVCGELLRGAKQDWFWTDNDDPEGRVVRDEPQPPQSQSGPDSRRLVPLLP